MLALALTVALTRRTAVTTPAASNSELASSDSNASRCSASRLSMSSARFALDRNGCGVGTGVEAPAESEVEQDRGGHDRHDVVGLRPDRQAHVPLGEPVDDAAGGGEAVRASAGEADRVDALHEVGRGEQVGLARARPAPAHVDAADRARWREHDGRPRQPSSAPPLVLADPDAGDVGQRVAPPGRHGAPAARKRPAAST